MERATRGLFAGIVVAGLAISWTVSAARAVPPDPDNAALLYYQAFLTLADLDKETRTHIGDVAAGKVAPDEKVREYIGGCRGAIEFAEAARALRVCNWGLRYSRGFDALMPQLGQMRFLAYVLLADARVRAADGDYKPALDRCLMMGSFARHIGDDTLISYLVSVAVQRLSFECMEDIIGRAAGDAELLGWLKSELATQEVQPTFPITALKIEREITLETMTMANVEKLAQILAPSEEAKRTRIVEGANEQVLAQARHIYSDNMTSALTVLSASMPYEQAHQRLAGLEKALDPNDPATAATTAFLPALVKVLNIKTTQQAHANAAGAAVDICLHKARTGSLPAVLPEGLPKDPFSGRDFQYERTADGFVLRCQGKDLDKGTIQEFKLKVN